MTFEYFCLSSLRKIFTLSHKIANVLKNNSFFPTFRVKTTKTSAARHPITPNFRFIRFASKLQQNLYA
ncbi:hypothetical protein L596_013930 [Steinernema carpocapsae]|uniref:Uncharacterized protein n=1 Tax=Steinernema carpocapsae TaxID=34508 RepID=A0A4U5P2S1_STECR|nr:hypothetical protein L596_013930 [Steinernema carpocapsae]